MIKKILPVMSYHESSLTSPVFIEVCRRVNKQSFICVLGGIDFVSFYDYHILFWKCSDSVVFFFFSILFN